MVTRVVLLSLLLMPLSLRVQHPPKPVLSERIGPPPKVMVASYYHRKFHGRITASGQRFDRRAFTAAHRELPFGTRLKVTNIFNGKSVEVLVNDRGPFILSRSLDLSPAAALALGMIKQGVIDVTWEIV